MRLPASLKWIGLALLGLLIATAVALAATGLISRQIGIDSESITAGDKLAPAFNETGKQPTGGSESEGGGESNPGSPAETGPGEVTEPGAGETTEPETGGSAEPEPSKGESGDGGEGPDD